MNSAGIADRSKCKIIDKTFALCCLIGCCNTSASVLLLQQVTAVTMKCGTLMLNVNMHQ